jgi:hypothetical protein
MQNEGRKLAADLRHEIEGKLLSIDILEGAKLNFRWCKAQL